MLSYFMTNCTFYKPSVKDVTPEVINQLRPLFDDLDKDHNGHLDKKELKKLFKSVKIDKFLAPIAFEICDTDKSGTITFNEFIPFFKLLIEMKNDPSVIYKNLFAKFDTDNSGCLNYQEAAKFVQYFVPKDQYSEEVFTSIFEELDKNHDGDLTFSELMGLLNNDQQ